jgi:hypothetical protein
MMAPKKTDNPTTPSIPTSEAPAVPPAETAVSPADPGNGSQALAPTAPRDAYMLAFTQAKDEALVKLQAIADKYTGAEQEQIISLIRSVNPAKEGLEEMAKGFQIPTVWVMQPTTKQSLEGVGIGDLYTSFGSKIERPLRFVPLYGFEMNRMFPQDGTLGRPVCMAPDGKLGGLFGKCAECQYLPMGKNNTGDKTDCDNVLTYIVLAQTLRLYRLEFAKSSRKAGSRINQLASEGDAIWDRWLALNTVLQHNEKGKDYNIFTISSANQASPTHIREAAEALYHMLRGERTAYLHQHWQTTMKRGAQASGTDEKVDLIGLGITGGGGDNPDVTKGL